MNWTMQPVMEHLGPRLSGPDGAALITALLAALSDRENLPVLEEVAVWRELS